MVVDDAIRSTSLHGLVGAGLALLLGTLTRLTSLWMGFLDQGVIQDVFQIVNLASVPFALLLWYRLGIDQPWVVRRGSSMKATTA